MKTRIISGVVMLPLLAVLYFGGWAVKIAGFLVAVIGIKEFYSGFEKMDIKPSFAIGMCSAAMLFYLLSDGPSIRNHRITSTDFRPCSTRQSRSQATLYAYALLGRFPFALR